MSVPITNESLAVVSKQRSRFLEWAWPVSGAITSIAAIDGLRGLAVLMTALSHLFAQLVAASSTSNTAIILNRTSNIWTFAATGVHLFFVLSGFLLFIPFVRAYYHLQKAPSISKFYTRRALRIIPAYWASLFLIIIFFKPQFLNFSQIPNIGLHLIMFHDWTDDLRVSINSPYWTMAVESRYYLILPLIALTIGWAVRNKKRWLVITIAVSLMAISPIYSLVDVALKYVAPTLLHHIIFFELLNYLCCFAGGMFVAWLYVLASANLHQTFTATHIAKYSRIAGIGGVTLFLIYIFVTVLQPPLLAKFDWLFTSTVLAVCYTGLLMGTVLGWKSWAKFFSNPILRFVGIISYSLYIWNEIFYINIIVPIAIHFGNNVTPILVGLTLTILILIPFCYLFYQLVERPFIGLRRNQH